MKRLKKKWKYLVAAVIGCILFGILFFMRPSVTFIEGKQVLEKGTEYKAEDFVAEADGTVIPEKEMLPTEEVGEFTFHYVVKKWLFQKDCVFSYTVRDTTPPHIEIKEKTIYKDPEESYTVEEMQKNVSTDEGTVSFDTNYNPALSGSYFVNVHAKDDYCNASDDSYEVIVRDLEEPFIFVTGDGAEILKGEEFNVMEIVSYGDNADPEPDLTIEGEVDTENTGFYPLHATLTDASGNRTEWDFTVEVVDAVAQSGYSMYSYPFHKFKEDHAGENRKYGIDISAWQEEIDFHAVKEAGCEFAMIRIGYSHNGEMKTDKYFRQNIEGAKKEGLPVGIYMFVYDNTEEELLSSMEMMFDELGDEELDLPIVFDWENFENYQDYMLSFQQLNQMYDLFEQEVTKRGYECMLYGSKYYLENIWAHTDTRPVWLAHYTSQTNYGGPYQIWQCTASGTIDGINGNVDLDILYQ
ncbi:MAG: hypothetical protein IKR11_13245 [Solobacterium sp.]|nr:hypothetical protein [Solobacterium sp.]